MRITFTTDGQKLKVASPYHPDLPQRAKRLGGKWTGDCWQFDIRDEKTVRELYRDVYGWTDEPGDQPLVTLHVTVVDDGISFLRTGVYLAGRNVCYATGRDSGGKLAQGIVFQTGKPTSGGSVKNWRTGIKGGSEFLMRDVFPAAAQRAADNPPDWIKSIKIINQEPMQPTRQQLETERDTLRQRLERIEGQLAALGNR